MSIEKFIALLKKELLRQSTASEKNKLQAMLEQEEEYAAIYQEVFSDEAARMKGPEMEAAFRRHWARLRKTT